MLGINVIRSIISPSKTPQAPLHLLNQVAPYLESALTRFRGLFAFFSVKKIRITKPLQVPASWQSEGSHQRAVPNCHVSAPVQHFPPLPSKYRIESSQFFYEKWVTSTDFLETEPAASERKKSVFFFPKSIFWAQNNVFFFFFGATRTISSRAASCRSPQGFFVGLTTRVLLWIQFRSFTLLEESLLNLLFKYFNALQGML